MYIIMARQGISQFIVVDNKSVKWILMPWCAGRPTRLLRMCLHHARNSPRRGWRPQHLDWKNGL